MLMLRRDVCALEIPSGGGLEDFLSALTAFVDDGGVAVEDEDDEDEDEVADEMARCAGE